MPDARTLTLAVPAPAGDGAAFRFHLYAATAQAALFETYAVT
jgi:hypothetical protein